MGFIMNMHDATSKRNPPFLIFVKCDSNNNVANLQIDGGGKQSLNDANGDETQLFETHMEELKNKELLRILIIAIHQHGFFSSK
jgi:hypothetical protein